MRGEEFEDLRELDDGGTGDGGETEGFGERECEAGCVLGVYVEDEGLVAGGAEEGEADVADGGGEGVG